MMTGTAKKPKSSEDKYKSAALDAIQERMRIDNFAPDILNAVESDVKLRNGIKELVAEAINEKKSVQDAVNSVVNQNQTNKIYKIMRTAGIVFVTAIITGIGTWVILSVLPENSSEIKELREQMQFLQDKYNNTDK